MPGEPEKALNNKISFSDWYFLRLIGVSVVILKYVYVRIRDFALSLDIKKVPCLEWDTDG
jgi:hypothetical protein